MKRNIASAPPKVWNRKNLPSEIGSLGQPPEPETELVEELPAVTASFARRHRGLLLLSVAGLGAVALGWYLSRDDR